MILFSGQPFYKHPVPASLVHLKVVPYWLPPTEKRLGENNDVRNKILKIFFLRWVASFGQRTLPVDLSIRTPCRSLLSRLDNHHHHHNLSSSSPPQIIITKTYHNHHHHKLSSSSPYHSKHKHKQCQNITTWYEHLKQSSSSSSSASPKNITILLINITTKYHHRHRHRHKIP